MARGSWAFSPHGRRRRTLRRSLIVFLILLPIGAIAWAVFSSTKVYQRQPVAASTITARPSANPSSGTVIEQGEVVNYSSEQTAALIRQANPGYSGPAPALKLQAFRYTMKDPNGAEVKVYARAFISTASKEKRPVFAFAPGTTGIDDQCAASLELPAKRNWANYASHMAAYAANGYVAVITDYEGMRDPNRMHHYMVGQLEGRAVLDSIRAAKQLPLTKGQADTDDVFLAGYSQGGHAAYWADKIASSYAPEVTIRGVIGFGPVTDVRQTLTDTTKGANILWFGPYVLYSYSDWYAEKYPVTAILQSPFSQNLASDIAKNCIDTNISYWGNRDIAKVYTPEFIAAMKTGSIASISPNFDKRMVENLTADTKTPSRKLINHGKQDNVVLPAQSEAALKRLCSLGSPTALRLYDATHYTTMAKSFADTLAWMQAVRSNAATLDSCPGQ